MEGLKSYATLPNNDDSEMLKLSRKIETGFPSPAGDHLEKALSLEDLIVRRPTSTFYVRAEGNAMKVSGIFDGDILVIDRSLNAQNGSIIVVSLDEEVIIRKLVKKQRRIFLVSGDVEYAPITIGRETNWMIWGVATHLIHRFRNLETQNQENEY
ncbi:MAG: translesion error-prone DNA polymerase V autoproteolytic subunit [Balneolaceae bacterium]